MTVDVKGSAGDPTREALALVKQWGPSGIDEYHGVCAACLLLTSAYVFDGTIDCDGFVPDDGVMRHRHCGGRLRLFRGSRDGA